MSIDEKTLIAKISKGPTGAGQRGTGRILWGWRLLDAEAKMEMIQFNRGR